MRCRGDPDLALPFGRSWTQLCESFVDAADQVTVSNDGAAGAVRRTHRPARPRRARLRPVAAGSRRVASRSSGCPADGTRLLLFGGTPRAHKGVGELLHALDRARRRALPASCCSSSRELGIAQARAGRPRALDPRGPCTSLRRHARRRGGCRPRLRPAGPRSPGGALSGARQDHRRARHAGSMPRPARRLRCAQLVASEGSRSTTDP